MNAVVHVGDVTRQVGPLGQVMKCENISWFLSNSHLRDLFKILSVCINHFRVLQSPNNFQRVFNCPKLGESAFFHTPSTPVFHAPFRQLSQFFSDFSTTPQYLFLAVRTFFGGNIKLYFVSYAIFDHSECVDLEKVTEWVLSGSAIYSGERFLFGSINVLLVIYGAHIRGGLRVTQSLRGWNWEVDGKVHEIWGFCKQHKIGENSIFAKIFPLSLIL